jgi:23S rRNA maturation mini-RNase III
MIDLNGLIDTAAALRQRRWREARQERIMHAEKQQRILKRLARAMDRQDAARVRGSRAKERESAKTWVDIYRSALGIPAPATPAEEEAQL